MNKSKRNRPSVCCRSFYWSLKWHCQHHARGLSFLLPFYFKNSESERVYTREGVNRLPRLWTRTYNIQQPLPTAVVVGFSPPRFWNLLYAIIMFFFYCVHTQHTSTQYDDSFFVVDPSWDSLSNVPAWKCCGLFRRRRHEGISRAR
jgi:hypothetical protein